MTTNFSLKKLQREFHDINSKGDANFTVGLPDENNFFRWEVTIEGPENTIFEGSVMRAILTFPQDYPLNPPDMVFQTKMWHPNIFKNGKVCISILHPPVMDEMNLQERMDEKWRPVLGVKEVVLSVTSMLIGPNLDSPANVDAAVQYKNDMPGYKKRVRQYLEEDNN
jgi:ubiquitin-conjugating enzyme E2 G1